MVSVLWEAGAACLSRAPEFTPVFGKARIAHLFSFLCCVLIFQCYPHVNLTVFIYMFYCLLTWSRTEYSWINVRENRRDNHEWTIQRNWQHWVNDIMLNVKDAVFHINYMSNMASVLWEAGVACPSRAPEFTPVFGKARIAHLFSFLCCVFVFVGLEPHVNV
jgi:hypothetical protein